ncbi:MAG: cytochrome b/b6 domain-containing protein [Bacteroidetes bacterium]|nr:cytochrome b/b6 domain-containing protein [Bacteroidota bacterium]
MPKKKTFLSAIFTMALLTLGAMSLVAQTNDDCLACHSDREMTMEKNGREISLYTNASVLRKSSHAKQSCVSCHTGFDPNEMPHKENIQPVRCTSCHQDAVVKHQFHSVQLTLARQKGTLENACKQCHGTHEVMRLDNPASPFHESNLTQSCAKCHEDVSKTFAESGHGQALAKGIKGAPTCIDCHTQDVTGHQGKLDKAQTKLVQEQLCLDCHTDNEDVRKRMGPTAAFIKSVEQSVHGRALRGGNGDAASCVDCHGSHEMKSGWDPTSKTHKSNIADDCGACHTDIATEFKTSIHGKAIARGNLSSPSCTDCHGEHNILNVADPNAPVAPQNLSRQVCSPCHSSLALSEKYGLDSRQTRSYEDSYHGLALVGGSAQVANCASCHGVHNILPSSDPASLVHKDNLVATCGTCHPNASVRFATGKIHVVEDDAENEPLLYWIATIYILLIIVIIGGMLLHNILDFRRKAINKLKIRRGHLPHHIGSTRLHVRMTLNERLQHGSLLVSFMLLVITGFMLRFPEAWWVEMIRGLSEDAFEYRSLIHRIAGVWIIAASVYHIFYLAFTERGRQLFFDLLPRWKDATDAVGVLKYNIGLSEIKPKFERFSYIEKAEYWALVWGNIVMGATGVLMWFDEYFLDIFTKVGYDVARSIHYYEAWLATLAILVWHIYFVIFNPDVYPMNLAWLKGTITEEEMEDEHPLELERIRQAEGEDADSDMVTIPTDEE